MTKKVVKTTKAPAAIGPYSQGLVIGDLVFTSGQLPIDQATGTMPEGIEAQAKQSLTNVKTILESAGSSMQKAIKVTVYLTNMNDFAKINEVYQQFFEEDFPSRSVVEVSCLPKKSMIEVDAIGYI